ASGPWNRTYVQSVVSSNGCDGSRSWMHSGTERRRNTSKTSSWIHDGSRSSTAKRIDEGTSSRNSSRRCTFRFHRGGSCTSVGPRGPPQPPGAVQVVGHPCLRVAQLLSVRPERAELERVEESWRCRRSPALDG